MRRVLFAIVIFCASAVSVMADSIPAPGSRYEISPVVFDQDNPILEWNRELGEMAVVQVGYFPEVENVRAGESVDMAMIGKRIILSSSAVTGDILVESVRKSRYGRGLFEIDMTINLRSFLDRDDVELPFSVSNGEVRLYQVERQDLRPCFFEVDHAWPDAYIPTGYFD